MSDERTKLVNQIYVHKQLDEHIKLLAEESTRVVIALDEIREEIKRITEKMTSNDFMSKTVDISMALNGCWVGVQNELHMLQERLKEMDVTKEKE